MQDATINARIPRTLRDQIDQQASRLGWKPAQIVRAALEHYLLLIAALPTQRDP